MSTFYLTHDAELYHYGVLGMKWGVRRYQNPDGSLTAAGKHRYGSVGDRKLTKAEKRAIKSGNKRIRDDAKNLIRSSRESDSYYLMASDAKRKLDKARNKYSENQSSKNRAKLDAAKERYDTLSKERIKKRYENERAFDRYYKYSKDLINKYGDKRISSVQTRARMMPDGSINLGVSKIPAKMYRQALAYNPFTYYGEFRKLQPY